jgi:hypothetical protein
MTEVAQFLWPLYFLGKSDEIILTKNGLGHILGDFFTNSSGHSAPRSKFVTFSLENLFFNQPPPQKKKIFDDRLKDLPPACLVWLLYGLPSRVTR